MLTTTTRPSTAGRQPVITAARTIGLAGVAIGALATGITHAAECENPDALTFAMVPTEETVAELELYKPVTDRMAKLTGKKIEFFMPTSYASVVEGIGNTGATVRYVAGQLPPRRGEFVGATDHSMPPTGSHVRSSFAGIRSEPLARNKRLCRNAPARKPCVMIREMPPPGRA